MSHSNLNSHIQTTLFKIAKAWKKPKCPSVEKDKQVGVYSYTLVYYVCIKKKKILSFATIWMDFEGLMLVKKSGRQRHILCNVNYM